jgi:hypothetical protein
MSSRLVTIEAWAVVRPDGFAESGHDFHTHYADEPGLFQTKSLTVWVPWGPHEDGRYLARVAGDFEADVRWEARSAHMNRAGLSVPPRAVAAARTWDEFKAAVAASGRN